MDRLINENAVLSAIGEWIAHNEHTYTNATEYLRNRVKAIKTAEQEPTAKENLVVGDCISRKALIEYANNLKDGIGITANDIARFPSIQPKPKTEWIPVSERLPKEGEKVLCWTTYNAFEVGYRDNEWGQDVWTTGEFASGTFRAVAWMPLPEPYKTKEE